MKTSNPAPEIATIERLFSANCSRWADLDERPLSKPQLPFAYIGAPGYGGPYPPREIDPSAKSKRWLDWRQKQVAAPDQVNPKTGGNTITTIAAHTA